MNESTLWFWLRDKALPPGHWVRIENRVGLGTPDVNGCFGGVECWLELKYSKAVLWETRPFRKRGLRTEQIVWLEERAEAQGNAWIVAGVGKDVFFLPASYASSFNAMSLGEIALDASLRLVRGQKDPKTPVFSLLSSRKSLI